MMTIDDSESFTIEVEQNAWGSDVQWDGTHTDFGFNGDGLRLDYLEPVGMNEYNIRSIFWLHSQDQDTPQMTFYMRNVLNKTLTFHIISVNSSDWYYNGYTDGHFCPPIWTGDGANWNRVANYSYNSTSKIFTFTFTPSSNIIMISRLFPFNYQDSLNLVDSFHALYPSFTQVSVAGYGEEAVTPRREIRMIELTDFSVAETSKKRIVIIANQHACETYGGWIIEGMMPKIMELYGQGNTDILSKIHWYLIPLMNVDSAYNGISRNNSSPGTGKNQNRSWDGVTETAYEIIGTPIGVKNTLQAIHNEKSISCFIDIHGLLGGTWANALYRDTNSDATCAGWCCCGSTSLYSYELVYGGLPMRTGCSPQGSSASMAKGWAVSKGIPCAVTWEPCMRDPVTTNTNLINEGKALAHALYNAYKI